LWISSDQNREADALAWIAVHQLIEHKKAVLKSARSHPDRGRWVPLVEMAARRLYPGDILERDIDQMQCLCRRCRPESAGSRPEQEDTGD